MSQQDSLLTLINWLRSEAVELVRFFKVTCLYTQNSYATCHVTKTVFTQRNRADHQITVVLYVDVIS